MVQELADEDALIEQGDVRAAAQSEEVHEDIRPDLGGWTGGLVWEASQVLARLLIAQSAEFWRRHSRVVELGCGCGLVGLTAAALGAEEVTLTDQVLFVAEHNQKHGGLDREAQERVSVRLLWLPSETAADHTQRIHAERAQLEAAVALDPTNQVFFSNRSVAYTAMQMYEKALEDADECVRLQPTWAKGYSRRAAAKFHLGDLQAAKLAYSKAWDLEPTNAKTKADLEHVLSEIAGMRVVLPDRQA